MIKFKTASINWEQTEITGNIIKLLSKMDENKKLVSLEELLTERQLQHIVTRCVGPTGLLIGSALRPAAEGLAGFVGDHSRLSLEVLVENQLRTLQLFVKSVPRNNDAKIRFIRENGFFQREITVIKLIEEMETDSNPFVTKAVFYNDSILVMPDLVTQGYSIRNQLQTFDLQHTLVALSSMARFHAAFANYETRKTLALHHPYSFTEDHEIIAETTFKDTPWIRTAAKLTANIIQKLSKYNSIPDLEANVLKQFLAGCRDLTHSDSLNVIVHKDLWVNNIMFKYENGVPTNAILVDFQCVRYGPPAFDVAMLLYLITSRSFRQQSETAILRNYFEIFMESLDSNTKRRVKSLGYEYEEYLRWIEFARRFAMVAALSIFPFVLMDPATASEVFDDPETYERLMFEDRTEAVLAQARRCPEYGQRQVEVAEEFVERCLGF